MSNPNANVRHFMGGINAAAYWIGDHLLRGADIVNDSGVTGTTVKAALNTLSAASTAVFPFSASGLAEQNLISYDASTSTWRNRSKVYALKGTGDFSFCVGTYAYAAGTNDIILGSSAGTATNTGSDNIGIGTNTLDGATMALQNIIAIGGSALSGALTAAANGTVALGAAALLVATSGRNTAVGFQSGIAVGIGTRNTLVGYGTSSAAAANDNTFVGDSVGTTSVGSRNTAVGSQAFNSASAAVTDTVALGYNALTSNMTSTGPSGSVAIGSTALAAVTTGLNTAVGFANQLAITTGSGNTTLGYNVMSAAASNLSNVTAVGHSTLTGALTSGANTTTIVGASAFTSLTSGSNNTGLGFAAGTSLTGTANVLIGYLVGASLGLGSNNVLVGSQVDCNSLSQNTVLIGQGAGGALRSRNTGIGSICLNATAVVEDCTAVGYSSLRNLSNVSANGSSAFGSGALSALTTGINTAVGYNAGDTLTTGSSNTIVGYDADVTEHSRAGCVILGRGASGAADDTLVIRMGNSSAKELTITPVTDAHVRVANTYLPIKVGATQYYMPLYT